MNITDIPADQIIIFVDGDACPVKDEVLRVAERHKLPVYLVSNQWLRMDVGPLVQKIVVSEGADEARPEESACASGLHSKRKTSRSFALLMVTAKGAVVSPPSG